MPAPRTCQQKNDLELHNNTLKVKVKATPSHKASFVSRKFLPIGQTKDIPLHLVKILLFYCRRQTSADLVAASQRRMKTINRYEEPVDIGWSTVHFPLVPFLDRKGLPVYVHALRRYDTQIRKSIDKDTWCILFIISSVKGKFYFLGVVFQNTVYN